MLRYKLKKLIFKENYLSTKIDACKPAQLKNQISAKRFYEKIILWIIGLFLFISIYAFFLVLNYFNINITINPNLVKEFIENTLTIPISFVSIIIPIITLALSYLKDKVDNTFKNVYLGPINPIQILIINTVYLSLLIVLLLSSFQDLNKNLGIIILTLAIVSILMPIIATAMLVIKSLKLVTNEISYEPIIKQFEVEIKEILDFEISSRLFKKLFKKEFDELKIYLNPTFGDYTYESLISSKEGYLIDIDLKEMKSFSETMLSNHESNQVIITIPPFSEVSEGNELGYVKIKDDTFESKLNNSLIMVNKSKNLGQDLNKFKDLILVSIKNNQENEFKSIFDVYYNGLKYYMKLMDKIGVKFTLETLKEPFNEWRLLSLIRYDLDDIIKNTAESSNTNLIGYLSFKFMDVFNLAIKFEDFSVFKMINLYSSIYYWSFENENMVGVDRSVRYLNMIINNIIKSLENPKITVPLYSNSVSLLYFALTVLINIFKKSIDNQDFDTFKGVYDSLSQQLNYFRPDDTNLRERKRELNSKSIRNNDEIELIESILKRELEKEVQTEVFIQKFEAASYIAKKIKNNTFKVKHYKKFIEYLLDDFYSYKKLVEVLEYINKRETGEKTFHLSENIWELNGYSIREAIIIRILFVFCLKGSQLTKKSSNFDILKRSKTVQHYLTEINSICEFLKDSNWEWFIGVETDTKINKFQEECKK